VKGACCLERRLYEEGEKHPHHRLKEGPSPRESFWSGRRRDLGEEYIEGGALREGAVLGSSWSAGRHAGRI